MRRLLLLLTIGIAALSAWAEEQRTLDDIKTALEQASVRQVQEKVYVHTDNMCYFVGDTLWYKAYVVRADDLKFTDMSRLLYVELLSPDGLLVERQTVVVSDKGLSCGGFALPDSLYGGYYELRAYTRWMLNFNVIQHRYSRTDRFSFYNNQMARDYFRQWEGLYSRVLPIYSKPDEAGDFTYKRFYSRPKQRIQKPKKERLNVNFFPEGGSMVEGVKSRVAFEVTDQLGQAVNISGAITRGDETITNISTEYMGRGTFDIVPTGKKMKASFTWRDKHYSFTLPEAESAGAVMRVGEGKVMIASKMLPKDCQYGLSVMCRGVLKHFCQVEFDAQGSAVVDLPQLPTGVNNVTLFDTRGKVIADRLFFINNHDYDGHGITVDLDSKNIFSPYSKVSLNVQAQGVAEPTNISIAVRDTRTDEATYDNGDIMTDLLLSSELKGFVASPAYYFEADDEKHRRALDLLMMVQGWRKYKWQELSDTAFNTRRYQPETTLTVEGSVHRMLSINEVLPEEIAQWKKGVGMIGFKAMEEAQNATSLSDQPVESEFISTEDISVNVETTRDEGNLEYGSIGSANEDLGVNQRSLKYEVLVEAELALGQDIVASVQKTNESKFLFQIPPFYGNAFLKMKAYKEKDSLKKSMLSRQDAEAFNEDAFPDYYVKRDLFFPRYTTPYNYYQDHAPDFFLPQLIDTVSELSMENDVYQLQGVDVKGKRRGRRAVDYTKPAYVRDAYDLYNDITDYGLSFGKLDMRQFPVQICRFLYGNMGRYDTYNVDARVDGEVFYRNYSIADNDPFGARDFDKHTPQGLYGMLKLKRFRNIKIFSDYEPRSEDSTMVSSQYSADAIVEFDLIPNDGHQFTSRDRNIFISGISMPVQFYNPDYSNQQPAEPKDYRRTLYWNPNARTDAEGRFTATFFTGSKEARIKVNAAGLTSEGKMLYTE